MRPHLVLTDALSDQPQFCKQVKQTCAQPLFVHRNKNNTKSSQLFIARQKVSSYCTCQKYFFSKTQQDENSSFYY
jgi:hypothetical protein